jgi:uncharacterized protein (TIGR03000 family)
MKARNVLAFTAGLLTLLAFVQQASAQERGKQENNRGNTGHSDQERGKQESNRGNTGQNDLGKDAGINHGQTEPAIRGDAGRTDNGRDLNRGQTGAYRNGNGDGYGREGYGSTGEGWQGSNYGRRGWRGNRQYYGNYGNGFYDNGFYGNQYPSNEGQRFYSGSNGRVSGYFNPEMDGQLANNCVLIRLSLPSADAQVWFENAATQQRGFNRVYISPPIETGKNYTYNIKATWMENGHEVTREKKLQVYANQTAMANFEDRGGDRHETINTAPDAATTKRENTLGRPELQEPELKTSGLPESEKTTKSSDFVAGKVVSVNGDRLTITESTGNNQRTFQIPDATQITLNGQRVANDALKAGMQVSVSLKQGTKDVANRVEVTSSAPQEKR